MQPAGRAEQPLDPGVGGGHPSSMGILLSAPPAWDPAALAAVPLIGIGIQELLIVLLIAVLIFGARRLPEIGAGLGKAIKNFRAGVSGEDEIDVTPKKEEVTEGESKPGA